MPKTAEEEAAEKAAAEKAKKDAKDGLTLEETQKALGKVRDEAAKRRIENKELKDRLDGIEGALKQALGLDDKKGGDIEAVLAELKSLKTELLHLKTRDTFAGLATKAGADADLTLAVMRSSGKLDDLDLGNQDAAIAAIKAEVAANPKLAAVPPGKSGAEHGTETPGKEGDMNALIRRQAGRSE